MLAEQSTVSEQALLSADSLAEVSTELEEERRGSQGHVAKVSELQQTLVHRQEAHEALERQLTSAGGAREQHLQRVSELEGELAQARAECEALSARHSEAAEVMERQATKAREEHESERERLQREINLAHEQAEALRATAEDAGGAHASLSEQLSALRTELHSEGGASRAHERRAADLETAHQQALARHEEAVTSMRVAQEEMVAKMLAEQSTVSQQWTDSEQAHALCIQTQQVELETARSRVQGMQSGLHAANRRVSELETEHNRMQVAKHAADSTAAEASEQHAVSTESIEQLRAELLISAVEGQENMMAFEATLGDVQTALDGKTRELAVAVAAHESALAAVAAQKEETGALVVASKEHSERAQGHERAVETLHMEHASALAEAMSQRDSAHAEASAARERLIARHDDAMSSLKAEIEAQRASLVLEQNIELERRDKAQQVLCVEHATAREEYLEASTQLAKIRESEAAMAAQACEIKELGIVSAEAAQSVASLEIARAELAARLGSEAVLRESLQRQVAEKNEQLGRSEQTAQALRAESEEQLRKEASAAHERLAAEVEARTRAEREAVDAVSTLAKTELAAEEALKEQTAAAEIAQAHKKAREDLVMQLGTEAALRDALERQSQDYFQRAESAEASLHTLEDKLSGAQRKHEAMLQSALRQAGAQVAEHRSDADAAECRVLRKEMADMQQEFRREMADAGKHAAEQVEKAERRMHRAVVVAEEAERRSVAARDETTAVQNKLRSKAEGVRATARAGARERIETEWRPNGSNHKTAPSVGGGSVEALVHTQAKLSVSEEALKKARHEARLLRARLMDLRREADAHPATPARAGPNPNTKHLSTPASSDRRTNARAGLASNSPAVTSVPNRHGRRLVTSSSAIASPDDGSRRGPRPRECILDELQMLNS